MPKLILHTFTTLMLALVLGGCFSPAPRPENNGERRPAQASLEHRCQSSSVGLQGYSWCADVDPTSTSNDLIYYFHGNGESEHSWLSHTDSETARNHRSLYNTWRARGVQAPTVVTLSFGPTWYINETENFFSPSLQKILVETVIPAIEAQLGHPVKRRVLIGESMGGYNASLMVTKQGVLFDRVALSCPAILPISPFASEAEVQKYVHDHQPYLIAKVMTKWMEKIRRNFPTPQNWRRHDPLVLVNNLGPKSPPLWVMGDEWDAFGFYDGMRAFSKAARKRGVKLQTWSIPQGIHCQYSAEALTSLARFLSGENL